MGGDASARFLVYEAEVEMAEWAADEKFLQKLADEGRGEFRRGSKLAAFLEQLPLPPAAKTKPRVDLAPDWTSASWSPFLVRVFRAVYGAAGRGMVPAAALGHGVTFLPSFRYSGERGERRERP